MKRYKPTKRAGILFIYLLALFFDAKNKFCYNTDITTRGSEIKKRNSIVIVINQNQAQLAEFKQRFISYQRAMNPEETTTEAGEDYEQRLDLLAHTADMLAEFVDGCPWWYLTVCAIINARCDDHTPLSELNPIAKAQFCEILMAECLDSIKSELALHGREWVHPFEREQEPTTTHPWQNQGF